MADNHFIDNTQSWDNDSAWSLAHVPDVSENAVMDAVPLIGTAGLFTLICNNFVTGTVTSIDATWGVGNQVTMHGRMSGFTGGISIPITGPNANRLDINPPAGITILADNCIFSIEPQGPVSGADDDWECSFSNLTPSIVGTGGTTTFGAASFGGSGTNVSVTAGTCIVGTSATFSGAGTVNLSPTNLTINSGATLASATINPSATITYIGPDSQSSTWTPTQPNPDDVLVSAGGNYIDPANNQVAAGVAVGVSPRVGTQSLVFPATNRVLAPTSVGSVNGVSQGTGTASAGGSDPMIPIAPATQSVAAGAVPTKIQDVSTADNAVSTLSLQVTAPSAGSISLALSVRVAASGNIVPSNASVLNSSVNFGQYLYSGTYPVAAGTTSIFTGIPVFNAIDSIVIYATTTATTSQNVTSSGSLA